MTSPTKPHGQRHAKGSIVGDIVKFLKIRQKNHQLPPLSSGAQSLLDDRILPNGWYPLEAFVDLLKITDDLFIGGKEAYAMEIGAAGAMKHFQGIHKAIVRIGDPKNSVLATRHIWRSHLDFGDLTAQAESEHAVVFTLKGYEDMMMAHGMMIAGWGAAAARAAGAQTATAEALERPWMGAKDFRYRVRF